MSFPSFYQVLIACYFFAALFLLFDAASQANLLATLDLPDPVKILIFWVSALTVFASCFPIVWFLNISLLASTPIPISWRTGFLMRFWAGLPLSLSFAILFSLASDYIDLSGLPSLILISLILSFCLAPSAFILSVELLEKSDDSRFASVTLGIPRRTYVWQIFRLENVKPLSVIVVLSLARALGEFLILFQVLNKEVSEQPDELGEILTSMTQTLVSSDHSLLLFLIILLALLGQTIIGIGGVFSK